MRIKILIGLVGALLGASAASAQTITDYDGTWDVLAQYELFFAGEVNGAVPDVICKYAGTALITDGSGPVDLALTSTEPMGQSESCESALNGTATIETAGPDSIAGSIVDDGSLGNATFTGEPVNSSSATAPTSAAPSGVQNGVVMPNPQGPFGGVAGGFSATRAPIMTPSLPPAIQGALLFLLVAGGGLLLLRRRTTA